MEETTMTTEELIPTTPAAAVVPITPATAALPSVTTFLSPPPVCGLVGVDTPNDIFLSRKHVTTSPHLDSPVETKQSKAAANKIKRNPALVIDKDNVPEINIIIPLQSIVSMIQSQFLCRTRKCRNIASKMILELETYGVASSLHIRCACGRKASALAKLTKEAELKLGSSRDGIGFRNKVNSLSFDLNYKIMLGLQLNGGGRQELRNVTGMLNLANNPMRQKITKLTNKIGLAILTVAKEVLVENLELEKEISPDHNNGRKLLSVTNDARWDKRASGRTYNSTSGCSVMMGCRTNLVLGLHCMSTRCMSCKKKEVHEKDLCSKNYNGSAKAMEATGALVLVKRLTTEEQGCYVKNYVSDDDATCRAILTHNFKDLIKAKLMKKSDVPRGNHLIKGPGKGAYKWNTGRLPLDHIEITKLADKGHRLRGHCSPIFSWSRGSKEKSRGGTTDLDALRYKRRGGWTLRLYGGETYDVFRTHCKAILEHHFDNHEFCGDWCKAKGKVGEEKKEHSLRFRCKEQNKEMYIAFKDLHDAFMDDEKLRQLHHQWDTNAVEGFNKLITKFIPKDRNLATTIENKARVHLAMGLLSIGYRRFFERVLKQLGLPVGDYTNQFIRSEDRDRQWRKHYRRRPHVMKARMENLYKRIREGNEKYKRDKKRGLDYGSGLMGVGGDNENDDKLPKSNKKAKKTTTTKGVCKHCGLDTHSRISSGLCPKNPKNAMVTSVECVEKGTCDTDLLYVSSCRKNSSGTETCVATTGSGIENTGQSDGSQSSDDEDRHSTFERREAEKLDAMEAIPLDCSRVVKNLNNDKSE